MQKEGGAWTVFIVYATEGRKRVNQGIKVLRHAERTWSLEHVDFTDRHLASDGMIGDLPAGNSMYLGYQHCFISTSNFARALRDVEVYVY